MEARSLLDELNNPQTDAEQMSFDQLIDEQHSTVDEDESPSLTKPLAVDTEVSGRHQDVRLYLAVLLKTFVELLDAGLVREAPFTVRFDENSAYQPDLTFIAHSSYDRLHDTYVEGPPDIIIEVLTPESTALDRGEKFVAYESAGVREYWLVDPIREIVDMYHLGPNGLYDEFRPDITGRLRSRVLRGFILDLDVLWQRALPKTTDIVEMAQAMLA